MTHLLLAVSTAEMGTAWYYFTSTVPQVFAAAYAVLLAVALVRIQQLSFSIERTSTAVEEFLSVWACLHIIWPSPNSTTSRGPGSSSKLAAKTC